MRPILILTKNLLVEQPMQELLQYLNYEVFCSVEVLKQLKRHPKRTHVLQNYQAIIFSETLTDEEVRSLLVFISGERLVMLRKFGHPPSIEEKDTLLKIGMNSWIYAEQSVDLLREQLAEHLMGEQMDVSSFFYQRRDLPRTLEEFKQCLTKKEDMIFDCLIAREGALVSREEICNYVWGSAPNNSRLAQTSLLVKRLKQKLYDAGFQEELIGTVWGNGYRLSPKLMEFYNSELVE
ncbi:helix-turn-helix domain-containing protein [Enterococcus sp. AZ109]|uniref:helix-turn-helix domain-containing protein n=1 Tax=Enterococcus sp. AZ109 TaxID=2774634 RepID=UPI003F1FCC20